MDAEKARNLSLDDYEKLGIKSDATLDDVKKRYDLLIRRSIHDESVNIDNITEAYDRIIAENTIDYFNPHPELLHAKGFNKKKLINFIYQRKVLIGVIVYLLIGVFVLTYMVVEPLIGYRTPEIVPFYIE